MSFSLSEFLDFNEKEAKESSGGGKGMIGEASYQAGWMSFVPGYGGASGFFPVMTVDEKLSQKGKCSEFMKKHGKSGDPSYGIMIFFYKDNVLSKDASAWKADLGKFTRIWEPATTEIVMPSIEEMGVAPDVKFYCRVGWKDDPRFVKMGEAGKKVDKQGNLNFPTVMYFAEKFANREEAMAAVASSKTPDVMPEAADTLKLSAKTLENWTPDVFEENRQLFIDAISEAVAGGKPLPLARKKVADDYSVDVADLVALDNTPM